MSEKDEGVDEPIEEDDDEDVLDVEEVARQLHEEGRFEGDPNEYPDPDNPTRSP